MSYEWFALFIESPVLGREYYSLFFCLIGAEFFYVPLGVVENDVCVS